MKRSVIIKNYFSLVKFAHTIFAMPFAMIGYFLGVVYAGAGFQWKTLLLVKKMIDRKSTRLNSSH